MLDFEVVGSLIVPSARWVFKLRMGKRARLSGHVEWVGARLQGRLSCARDPSPRGRAGPRL